MAVKKQTRFHRPCGHWHLRLFEETPPGYARNCWMPSLSVNGTHVFCVFAGKHMQLYPGTGCEIYMFDFDIGANTWDLLYTGTNIQAANFPGGTGFDDDICMFANYKADSDGTRLTETFSNYGIGVWVYRPSTDTMNYTEYAGEPEQYLQNKVGCHESGMAAFAYENAAGQLLVEVSTDWGATWNTRKTVGALAARNDYSLCVDKNGYIYLAHQTTTSNFMLEYSTNNGVAWATLEAGESLIANMTRMKLNKDGIRYYIFGMSATDSAAKFSDDGATWTSILLYSAVDTITAYGTYVDSERCVSAVHDYMNHYYYDDDEAAYTWTTREIPGYLPAYNTVPDFLGFDVGGLVDDLLEALGIGAQNIWLADLNGHNGVFAYSSFGFYAFPNVSVVIAVSVDNGESWTVKQTPLRFFGSGSEITDFDGNPRDWAERFTRQRDKYEHWNGL